MLVLASIPGRMKNLLRGLESRLCWCNRVGVVYINSHDFFAKSNLSLYKQPNKILKESVRSFGNKCRLEVRLHDAMWQRESYL